MNLKNYDIKRINQFAFFAIAELFIFIVIYKIFNVPITHDETPTTVSYCANYNVWEIMMYPDSVPNNHILNTLSTKFLLTFFQPEQWVVRFPNLLSALIFLFAVYRILKLTLGTKSLFFIPGLILFLANPYLNDFFSLCRGYGISTALATLSVSFALSAFQKKNDKHIWLSMFLAILASYANFTLLVFWSSIILMTAFYFYRNIKVNKSLIRNVVILIFINVLYFSLIIIPLIKMNQGNEFQYWEKQGFFRATIYNSVVSEFYGAPYATDFLLKLISISVVLITFLSLGYLIYKFIKNKYDIKTLNSPLFVATSILFSTAVINIIQCKILGTPNLTGRTAVFFYPLFICMFICFLAGVEQINNKILTKIIAVLLILIPVYHNARVVKLNSVREWWFDGNNIEVINYLKIANNEQKVSLKTNWLFHPSFYFYQYTGKTPYIDLKGYDKNITSETDADYYYVLATDYDKLKDNFDLVYKFDPDRWLLRRKNFKVVLSESDNKFRSEQINSFIKKIKDSKEWLESVEKKVLERNIPLDSMIYLDAVYMVENNQ